jgi:hypothetical protein
MHLASNIAKRNSETGANEPEIRVDLYIHGKNAKQEFAALEKQKQSIEKALGFPLTWHKTDAAACRLYIRQNADFTDESLWPQQFGWIRQKLESMHKVFAPIIKNLPIASAEPQVAPGESAPDVIPG